jgi:hypothetical protein
MIVNNKLERIYKGAVLAEFNVFARTVENLKSLRTTAAPTEI